MAEAAAIYYLVVPAVVSRHRGFDVLEVNQKHTSAVNTTLPWQLYLRMTHDPKTAKTTLNAVTPSGALMRYDQCTCQHGLSILGIVSVDEDAHIQSEDGNHESLLFTLLMPDCSLGA